MIQGAFSTMAEGGITRCRRSDSSGDDLFRMGLLYSTGQGGAPLDHVSAHMMFNLAAMRGSEEAKRYRTRTVGRDGP